MKKFYLGIDFGTSTTKATLIDNKGYIVYQSKLPVHILNPKPNFYEIDPLNWWTQFLSICGDIKKEVELKNIRSICISAICGTFVAVNEQFDPLYNAILYGIDTRSIEQVVYLNNKYPKEYLYRKLGGIFDTHSIIPKILWLKENLPNIYNSTIYFVESNNFITARLTGIVKWDYPTAAGAKLVDLTTLNKPEEIFKEIGIDSSKIPEFQWPIEILGNINKIAQKITSLDEDILVITGACDINAEAMSIGAIFPGNIIIVLGSTISLLLTLSNFLVVDGFINGVSILKNSYRIGAATSSGGRFIDWIKKFLDISNNVSEKVNRPTGIFILPYIDGARSPFNNPLIPIVFWGVKKHTTKSDILLASFEAIGYELALILDRINSRFINLPEVLYITGGLTANTELLNIISDITGKILKIYKNVDASFGDALLAMTIDFSIDEIYELPGVKNKLQDEVMYIYPNSEMNKKYCPLVIKFMELCNFANYFENIIT